MLQTQSNVLWNHRIAQACWRIGLSCPASYARANPGQFVMVHMGQNHIPLLRRPFSIHRLLWRDDEAVYGLELLVKVVGAGTRCLAALKAGDQVDLLGPLGRGFTIPAQFERLYLTAGGIGVAPMLFLAQRLRQLDPTLEKVKLFLGGRNRDELYCTADFRQLGLALHTSTDDGSAGQACLVTSPLEQAIDQTPPDLLYACGPTAMLQCVVGMAVKYQVACQLSIETLMACGMGACLGCAVEPAVASAPYLHACREGPVFDAHQIRL